MLDFLGVTPAESRSGVEQNFRLEAGIHPVHCAMSAAPRPMFIVLEIGEPTATRVIELRQVCSDVSRAALPAEITVAGSTGVSPLLSGQRIEEITQVMQAVAHGLTPIQAHFGPVIRFPDTDIFVFTLTDATPFRTVHHHLLTSTLKFEASPFPFMRHCTISRTWVTEEEAAERSRYQLSDSFCSSTLALHGLQDGQVTRMGPALP